MWFTDSKAAYDAGLQLYKSQQFADLEQFLRVALLQFPDDGRLLELQGILWHGQQRFQPARRALELASSIVTLSLAAQVALADTYRRCGQRADAHTIFTYLAGRPDLPTPMLAILTAGLGYVAEYQLALDVCREAVRRDPDCDDALYGMIFYMNKLNYPVECILPLFRRAISLDPSSQLYRLGLAAMCARAQQWDEAYEACCGLTAREVACPNCLNFVIRVFENAGDHERRDAWLSEVLRRSTQCPNETSRQEAPSARTVSKEAE
jgi:tetratricopeptide (TPR) repeat protein